MFATLQALAYYREGRCEGLVALGRGSPIDLAKAVAQLTAHPGPLAQYAAIDGGVAHHPVGGAGDRGPNDCRYR